MQMVQLGADLQQPAIECWAVCCRSYLQNEACTEWLVQVDALRVAGFDRLSCDE